MSQISRYEGYYDDSEISKPLALCENGDYVTYADYAERECKLVVCLKAAGQALRSYQYGNSATELAEEIADAIDAVLKEVGE